MATRPTKTRDIGGFTYTATALGARVGAEGLRRLGTTIGPILARAMGEFRSGGMEANMPAILGGVAALVQSLSATDLSYFIDLFGENTTVQTTPKLTPLVKNVFDELFACNYMAMGEFLALNLELNYGPFFLECRDKISTAMTFAAEPEAAA